MIDMIENAIHLAHALRELGLAGLDQQVIVVVHQAPCPNHPIESIRNFTQVINGLQTISIVEKNSLTGGTACHDMTERVFKLDQSWQAVRLWKQRGCSNARYTT